MTEVPSNDMFREIIDQTFTEETNGKVVELCPGGAELSVDKTNLEEYIRLMVDRRLNSSKQQVKWVQIGIERVIPLGIFSFLTPDEVDDRVCGVKQLDIDRLKSITEYESCSEDNKHVKWFWKILERMEPDDQTLYLRFTWGRARLPVELGELRYKHKIALKDYWDADRLPEAHTCFFTIDIAPAKDIDSMEQKLLTAIRFCGEIDND